MNNIIIINKNKNKIITWGAVRRASSAAFFFNLRLTYRRTSGAGRLARYLHTHL
jgi:hypothetical protein